MQQQHKYSENSKMSDLINEDVSLVSLISRFGLSLGFGDKSVKDICESGGIDTHTFLAVVNFISEGSILVESSQDSISIESVINYLKSAHNYFIQFKLPSIRTKLLDAVDSSDQSLPYRQMILKFYDEYVTEVVKHMDYENRTVFPYVMNLINGEKDPDYNIAVFEQNHEEIDSKLTDLKSILMKYYPAKEPNYLLNEVLFDLVACEKDLARHNAVEDYFFVPTIEAIENRNSAQ